jgi:rsbT co-antagonist protein RsbR
MEPSTMDAPIGAAAPRYERFFETSTDFLCVLDQAGRFVSANDTFHVVLGYPPATLLGKGFVDIVHPDDAAAVRAFFEESEGDDARRVSPRFIHQDQRHLTISFMLRRVVSDAAVYGTGRVATEHDSTELERRRAALLQMMEATALVGGFDVDLVTNENYWTDQTFRIHEVPPTFRPMMENSIAFYSPEAIPVITAVAQACILEAKPYRVELELITAKGRRLWVRAAARPVIEAGKVVRLIGAFQDIDSFKRREIELEEKLMIIEEQRSAIRALSAPIIQVWDRVLALPVVGTLDEERAAEITGRLLDAVVVHRAKYAILDLTGVETVDEGTAHHLVKIIRAIHLLGTKSIVTGIRPAMAQTLVALGAGFGGARTVSNLREAIKIAMRDEPVADRVKA